MAHSRCLAWAAVFSGVDGARISRKREVATSKDCFSKYDGMTLLNLQPCSSPEETISQLMKAGCTILDEPRVYQLGCADAEVVCNGEIAELEKAGIANIVTEDAGAFWRGSSGVTAAVAKGMGVASDFYSNWRDMDAQFGRVKAAVDSSGGVATLEVAGQTTQGRDMHIVRMKGPGYTDGGKRLFITYNLHAREWITGMAGVYAVEHLVEKVKADPDYLAGTEVVLMPMANPDGFLYSTTTDRMHRKNMRNISSSCVGVDLNRNFDAHWAQGGSSSNPCADTYHGPSAMSEIESNVIAGVMKEAPMSVYIDVHSFTQLVITSPAWTKTRSARHTDYRHIGGSIQAAIKARHGLLFTEGPVATTLYVATGGTIDYADDRGALGVCLELRPPRFGGGNFAPRPNQILPSAEETYDGILAAIDYAKNPGPPPPTPSPAPTPWFFR